MKVKQVPRRMPPWVWASEQRTQQHFERLRRYVVNAGLPPIDVSCIVGVQHIDGNTLRWLLTTDDGAQLRCMRSVLGWWAERSAVKREPVATTAHAETQTCPQSVTYEEHITNITEELMGILGGLEMQTVENADRVVDARRGLLDLPKTLAKLKDDVDADMPTLAKYGLQAVGAAHLQDLQRKAAESADECVKLAMESFREMAARRDALKVTAICVKRLRDALC